MQTQWLSTRKFASHSYEVQWGGSRALHIQGPNLTEVDIGSCLLHLVTSNITLGTETQLAERGRERVEVLKGQTRPEVVYTLPFTFYWLKLSQWSHLTSRESGEGSGFSLFDDIGFAQMFNDPCANSSLWLTFFAQSTEGDEARVALLLFSQLGEGKTCHRVGYLSSWSSGSGHCQFLLGDPCHLSTALSLCSKLPHPTTASWVMMGVLPAPASVPQQITRTVVPGSPPTSLPSLGLKHPKRCSQNLWKDSLLDSSTHCGLRFSFFNLILPSFNHSLQVQFQACWDLLFLCFSVFIYFIFISCIYWIWFKKGPDYSPKWLHHFTPHQQCVKILISPHPHSGLLLSAFLAPVLPYSLLWELNETLLAFGLVATYRYFP